MGSPESGFKTQNTLSSTRYTAPEYTPPVVGGCLTPDHHLILIPIPPHPGRDADLQQAL